MKKPFDKKIFAVLVAGTVLGFLFLPAAGVQPARANFFEDLFKNFVAPFGKNKNTSSSAETSSAAATSTPIFPQTKSQSYEPPIDYERAVIQAVKKASPAVVSITISKYVPIIEQCPYNPFPDVPPEFQDFFGNQTAPFYASCDTGKKELQEVGGGSGFVISSDGLILTNKHVVADKKASYTVFTNDGKKYDAKVLARDPVQDLAVIKIEATGLSPVELGDSDAVELGQTAIAIGNALGEYRNTVSAGVISGLSRTVTAGGPGLSETIQGVIQTDAAINPGNSGGPLLNLRGQVIAINTAIASGAQNIGFAIPINQAKRDIASVQQNGEIRVPFLGVRYMIVTPDIAKKEKLPVDYGARVQKGQGGSAVEKNSPADKAGIVAGDIILEIDGQRIDKDHPLADLIAKKNVGDAVAMRVRRGDKELNITVTLEKRPETL